jgi:hypothetical protein
VTPASALGFPVGREWAAAVTELRVRPRIRDGVPDERDVRTLAFCYPLLVERDRLVDAEFLRANADRAAYTDAMEDLAREVGMSVSTLWRTLSGARWVTEEDAERACGSKRLGAQFARVFDGWVLHSFHASALGVANDAQSDELNSSDRHGTRKGSRMTIVDRGTPDVRGDSPMPALRPKTDAEWGDAYRALRRPLTRTDVIRLALVEGLPMPAFAIRQRLADAGVDNITPVQLAQVLYELRRRGEITRLSRGVYRAINTTGCMKEA